ncbi:MAG: hypothetical protein JWM98_180 [Thermoleophilia bacterium]|nr:hypothetical protein [Thermoleophilia bacterium]
MRRRLPALALAVLLGLAAAAGPAIADDQHNPDGVAGASPAQIRSEGTNPRLGGKLAGYTAWVDAHGGASPDNVILGTSRAVQLDPRLIQRLTGRTTYNAAVSSGAARELLAVGDFVELLTPKDVPHLVVMLDIEAFDRRTPTKRVKAVLAAETAARSACRDRAACDAAWTRAARDIVRTAVAAARGLPAASNNQRPDGMQVNGNLETLDAQGVDLTPTRNKRIAIRIRSYRPGGGFDRLMPIPEAVFSKLMAEANARGDVPTVVITAMHPDCIRRCGPAGWFARRASALQFLAAQRKLHRFRLTNLSNPVSFGGGSGSFFDEIHLRPKAAAQVVRRLDRQGEWEVEVASPAPPSAPEVLAGVRQIF